MIRNPDNMSEGELRRLVRKIVDELYRNDWAAVYQPRNEDDDDDNNNEQSREIVSAVEAALRQFRLVPYEPCEMEEAGKPQPFHCTCDLAAGPARQQFMPADNSRQTGLKCEHVLCKECGGVLEMGRPGTCTRA